ncbi:hypothetical protein Smic_78580 [Streptomyces microflavus]|uniref:Uncharacterized protein n=1 Tax=Streptomyces microflavus TaxID=1919 RepID=A0A7J0D3K3_STRMI|nr:hypothetical protein Smic_78580 [Streptomyces microflavus]
MPQGAPAGWQNRRTAQQIRTTVADGLCVGGCEPGPTNAGGRGWARAAMPWNGLGSAYGPLGVEWLGCL